MVRRRLAWGFLLIAGLLGLVVVPSCAKAPDPWAGLDDGNRKHVVVSFPPLYSFVKAVGGDHVAVISLCIHDDPHEFKPDMQRSLVFHKAQLLFSNGLNLDPYAGNLLRQSDNKNIRHVEFGKVLPEDKLLEDDDHKGKTPKEYDPHMWLGTEQAILMVNKIRDELIALDPAQKEDYTKNAAEYVKKLEALRADAEQRLKGKANRKLVSSHEALDYVESTFNLEVEPIAKTPEEKVTATRMAKLVEKMRTENIRVIAIEPGEDNARKEADVLKAEIKDPALREKVKIIVFDPLETANEDELKAEGGDWYLKRMRQNLDALIEALP